MGCEPSAPLGVIVESSQNPALSGVEERRARVPQWPEAVMERFGWPNVVAIEGDVLPAERALRLLTDALLYEVHFINRRHEISGDLEFRGHVLRAILRWIALQELDGSHMAS